MAGYTRQDTANNIANGNVIDADDFDAEYDAIELAFASSGGHTHDGTTGGGSPITKVGPVQDLVISATALTPKTTNTLDLGTNSVQFKNAWFDGTVDTDALTVSGSSTIGGNLDVTGSTTLSSTLTASTVDINGGAIDATTIGSASHTTGKFTTLQSTGQATLATVDINGGNIDGAAIGSTSPSSGAFTTIDSSGGISGNLTGNVTGNVTGTVSDVSNHDTDDIAEGTTNLYFTDQRARDTLSASGSLSYDSATGAFTYTQDDTDTVSEGTTNLYFTDQRARDTLSASGSLSYDSLTGTFTYTQDDTDTVSEGTTNLYYTDERARDALSASGSLSYDSATGTFTYTQGNTDTVAEGSTNQYFTTARARASVSATGSLSYNSGTGVISFTQGDTDTVAEGTTNLYYTDARATAAAKAAISVTDAGGDGSLTYSAGAITYTGPSAAETRAHFSGGTGVSITDGVVAIGQDVGTTSNVTFNNTVVNGNLTVNGTTTTVNTETLNLADNQIVLNSNETGTPTQNGGIEIERGTATNKTLVWNEADDKWTVGSETFVAGTFEGVLSGTLATPRTIALSGDVSGSASFDGGSNVTISATVADDSHNHVISNIDGLQTEIDTKAELAGSGSQAFSASTLNATTVDLGAWTVTQSGTDLKFAYNGINRMKLDSSGNLTVEGNVTAYGSA